MGLEAAALAVAIGGTTASVISQKRAAKAQRKGDAINRAQAELENQRNIRQSIAASKLQRAQLVAAGETQTGSFGGSSAVTGALGAAKTQAGANIGFANQVAGANAGVNRQFDLANKFASNAQTFGAVAKLPGQLGFDNAAFIQKKIGNA